MRPGAPSVAEASRSLSSVKTGEPPTDDDIVTSVAYEPNDDAEPVSPELALVDPSLAARLRADLREAPAEPEPEPERAVAAPAEPVGASAPIPDQAPVEAPEPPVVVPVHHAPVALVQPLPGHGDPEDATTPAKSIAVASRTRTCQKRDRRLSGETAERPRGPLGGVTIGNRTTGSGRGSGSGSRAGSGCGSGS